MALEANSKISRWYKKQLLDRSDKEVAARMKKREAEIQNTVSLSRVSCVIDPVSKIYSQVFGTPQALEMIGFRRIAQSVMKLGHSCWKLTGEGGDVRLDRMEDEPEEAEKFPKRKRSQLDEDLLHLGYPKAMLPHMPMNAKVDARLTCIPFNPPEGIISIRGLPARLIASDQTHMLVQFQGSNIVDRQPIVALFGDPDSNTRQAALQEQYRALIPQGLFTLTAQQAAQDELSQEDMQDFTQTAQEEIAKLKRAAINKRVAIRCAQSRMHWSDFNDSSVNDFTEVLHGRIDPNPEGEGFVWAVYEEGRVLDQGWSASLSEAQGDCELAALGEPVSPPSNYVGMTVWNDLRAEPMTGTVKAEVPGPDGNVRFLDVEYENGISGRLDINSWSYDSKQGVIRAKR